MFRYEYRAVTRKRRPFVFRTLIAAVVGVVTLLVGLIVFRSNPGQSEPDRITLFGRSVFIATFCVELIFVAFFAPVFVGGSIVEERARDTLPLLLLTRLTRIEIVLTKAFGRWLSLMNLILTGFPVLVVSAWAAGLEVELGLALLLLTSSSLFMAVLAITASAATENPAVARSQAVAWIFCWLIMLPLLSLMPIHSTNLWGLILAELKSLCVLIAPSSPLSLVTDHAWYSRPSSGSLRDRVAWMIGLQALFAILAVGLASSRLKARETNPNWTDPTRGFRPPCGDDPIFWREYELPMRRGGGSVFAIRIRYVLILIKAILINYLTLLAMLFALATPIGLTVATIYYGLAAFGELGQYGYGLEGPFVERSNFNLVVRAATGLLALLLAMVQASQGGSRITMERDKRTWDALLTTPLSAREILESKARIAVQGLQAAWPILIIWALGLACGVVTPLGLLFTVLDLVLATWAFLAVGLYLSIRPGPTASTSSRSALSTLGLCFAHTPLIGAALASPPELAAFAAWDVRVRWAVVLVCLTIPLLTALTAWILTRRTLDRFDEWVGRPIRLVQA